MLVPKRNALEPIVFIAWGLVFLSACIQAQSRPNKEDGSSRLASLRRQLGYDRLRRTVNQDVGIEDVDELMTTTVNSSETKVRSDGLLMLFDVVSQSDLPIELLEARLRVPLETLLEESSEMEMLVRRVIVELDYKALKMTGDRVSFLKKTVQTERNDQYHYAREAVFKLLDLDEVDAGKVIEDLMPATQRGSDVRQYLSLIGMRLAAPDRKLDSQRESEQIRTIDAELSQTLGKRPVEVELDIYRWLLRRLAKIEGYEAGRVLKDYWNNPKVDIFLSQEIQELLYERGEIADSERRKFFEHAN